MINVKAILNVLWVKRMHHLTQDMGLTQSCFIWKDLADKVPLSLTQGLCTLPESSYIGLDTFYAKMLCSYVDLNNLFYEENKQNKNKSHLDLPINLWGHPNSKKIYCIMTDSGFCVVADLPIANGKIDVVEVQCKVCEHSLSRSIYLACYALKTAFGSSLGNTIMGSHLVHPSLVEQVKELSQNSHSSMLLLTKWEHYFHVMPLSKGEKQVIFHKILKECKITKFREVNFKILF